MKSEVFEAPFTKIAPYYDRLMSFVNYPSWVSYIEKILNLNCVTQKEILDLACGTGVCLELWYEKGYKVIGLDASVAMLDVCKNRFPMHALENGAIHLIAGDVRDFALPAQAPIITCLYDSLNYLLTSAELLRCFQSVHKNLSADGIFIFDMNTIHALQDEWGNQTFRHVDGPVRSVWANNYDSQTCISSLRLTITVNEGNGEFTFHELHQERAYSLTEIGSMLVQAGFYFSLLRHLTFNPANEQDIRIMGVARK